MQIYCIKFFLPVYIYLKQQETVPSVDYFDLTLGIKYS